MEKPIITELVEQFKRAAERELSRDLINPRQFVERFGKSLTRLVLDAIEFAFSQPSCFGKKRFQDAPPSGG